MQKTIQSIITSGVVLLTATASHAALVGLWEFNDSGNLGKATVGTDVAWTGSPTTVAGVSGSDGAASSPKGTYFTANNSIGGNGGGTRTNQYTLLFDLYLPTAAGALDGWNPYSKPQIQEHPQMQTIGFRPVVD